MPVHTSLSPGARSTGCCVGKGCADPDCVNSQLSDGIFGSEIATMPFKANAARRHHIPKQKRKVTNWTGYNAILRQRGSLTLWFSEEAIACWRAAPPSARASASAANIGS